MPKNINCSIVGDFDLCQKTMGLNVYIFAVLISITTINHIRSMAKSASVKWRSILGLVLIYLAMWYDWQWVWGVLFIIWVIPDLLSGVTYFMEPIEKKENPILYWIIVVSWLLMSVYSFTPLLFPEWKYY